MTLRNPDRWQQNLKVALGPLLELLEDDNVNEICVNGHDDVWVKRYSVKGFLKMDGIRWPSIQSLQTACTRITEVTGRRVNESKPIYDGRLPGGERINIVVPPACAKVAITIRKFPAEPMTLDKLEGFGAINRDVRHLLEAFIAAPHVSLITAGPTGSGKTSLLNALARLVPPDERIVTDEDVRELQVIQPNWVALETVEPTDKDMEPVEIKHLARSNLRQSPSRIFVGEVRGDEALYLMRALSTGHVGYGTVHANSAEDALEQLQLLASLTPGIQVSWFGLAKLVAKAIQIVVFADVFEDGSKKIREIVEVDQPGVEVLNALDTRFRTRCLARWETRDVVKEEGKPHVVGGWVFPEQPSKVLALKLKATSLPWPWDKYVE